jgi:hypothetical protein
MPLWQEAARGVGAVAAAGLVGAAAGLAGAGKACCADADRTGPSSVNKAVPTKSVAEKRCMWLPMGCQFMEDDLS